MVPQAASDREVKDAGHSQETEPYLALPGLALRGLNMVPMLQSTAHTLGPA